MSLSVQFSNGVTVPLVGIGTGGKRNFEYEAIDQVKTALDLGYRHIDTAQMYENEGLIGGVLKEYFASGKLKREDVFINTKLPPTANQPSALIPCFLNQLNALDLQYVDCLLIHSPASLKPQDATYSYRMYDGISYENDTEVDLLGTWKEMEKIYDQGLAKSIGLSNFNEEQIQKIYDSARVKPMSLQVEVHLHWQQKELLALCKKLNIVVTAYAPMGCPGKKCLPGWPETGPIDEPLVAKLAEKYGRTPAQILLRHLTQQGIVVIPKSTNPQRLKENLESNNFSLDAEDITDLNGIPSKRRFYSWPDSTKTHPEYPFTELIRK